MLKKLIWVSTLLTWAACHVGAASKQDALNLQPSVEPALANSMPKLLTESELNEVALSWYAQANLVELKD